MADVKLAWTEVDSSNVRQVAYHEPTKTLAVKFHGGGLYSYLEAAEETYHDMINAVSVGQYLNNVVKVQHAYTRWQSEADLLDHLNLTG